MKDVHDSDELLALRRKLYSRNGAANEIEQHGLTPAGNMANLLPWDDEHGTQPVITRRIAWL